MPKDKPISPTKQSRPVPVRSQRPVVKVPNSASDASSNWKMLLTKLDSAPNNNARFENRRKAAAAAAAASSSGPGVLATNYNVVNHPTVHYVQLHPPAPIIYQYGCYNNYNSQLTRSLAMDCEMVGVGPSNESVLARVSVVNEHGCCLLDKYVKPKVPVTDYRTSVSGIREENLRNAPDLESVTQEVSAMLHNRIVVGHAIHHDFKVLLFNCPRYMIRDTSKYFKKFNGGRTPSLKNLALKFLNMNIQSGEHSSVEDAQAVMRLYLLHREAWEQSLLNKHQPAPEPRRKSTGFLNKLVAPPPRPLPPPSATSTSNNSTTRDDNRQPSTSST